MFKQEKHFWTIFSTAQNLREGANALCFSCHNADPLTIIDSLIMEKLPFLTLFLLNQKETVFT